MGANLEGKVAVVTGAGRGIGRAVALRLAKEDANIVVAEIDMNTAGAVAEEIGAIGSRALVCEVDVERVATIQAMVERTVSDFGRIDILVNNAGVVQTKQMMEITEADWDFIMNINLRGNFFCLQAIARQMIRQAPEPRESFEGAIDSTEFRAAADAGDIAPGGSNGKILNLSSISGRGGRPLQAHYAASKAAVINITQSAAVALAPYHINVNAVAPGVVATAMWEKIDRERSELFGTKSGEAMAGVIKQVPLGRVSVPGDIAGAAAFLCGADSDFITGQTLNVDGGFVMT